MLVPAKILKKYWNWVIDGILSRIAASELYICERCIVFTLIKNCDIYDPRHIGRRDILICNEKIIKIDESIDFSPTGFEVETIDANDLIAVPGFIDQHVHITGGGGEGGSVTRTPEINLSDLTTAGITTVIGLLGTDGISRSMEALLAKARALELEGLTTYIYTGSYTLPIVTLTGSIQSDLVLIDKVIGVGEIAISDHRSSQPSLEDIKKLAAHTRVGGILSNKAGIVHLHLGDGPGGINYLMDIAKNTEIPRKQFMPTHINRSEHLVEQSLDYLREGGYIDLSSEFYKSQDWPDCMSIGETLRYYAEKDVPMDHICASSDANGSIPNFDKNGELISIGIGSAKALFKDIRSAVVDFGISLEQALALITINPAKALKLYPRKGTIQENSDADIVLLDKELNIHTVIAKGSVMVENHEAIVKGYFEKK